MVVAGALVALVFVAWSVQGRVVHPLPPTPSFAVDAPVHIETISGLEVMWQALPPARQRSGTRGLLLLFHGCNHQAGDFFDCDECLGLPEERAIVHEARSDANGYVVAAVSSSDRGMSRCWSKGADLAPVVAIVEALRKDGKVPGLRPGLPVFGLGASSGGGFVGALAAAVTSDGSPVLTAASAQISAVRIRRGAALNAALEFVTMPRDANTELVVNEELRWLQQHQQHQQQQQQASLAVAKRACGPLPVTRFFLYDRTAHAKAPIAAALAASIADALVVKGLVDPASGLLRADPRQADWRLTLERYEPEIAGYADLDTGPDESALSEALNVAWAAHEICASDLNKTFAFFEAAAAARGLR